MDEQLIVDTLVLDAIAIDIGRIKSEFDGATARSEAEKVASRLTSSNRARGRT